MPDDTDDTDDSDVDGSTAIRALREENKRLKKQADDHRQAAEDRPALERRLAFAEAGLGSHPMRDYFVKGYDGDLSSEAIRKAATEAGMPLAGAETVGQQQQQQQRNDDIEANRRMDDAMGAGTGGGTDFDSYVRELGEAGGDWKKIEEVIRKYPDHIRMVNDDV